MFESYLKTAVRNLLRNRRHALLNISGLSVALAACLVVFMVIRFEYGHNRHLTNYERIFHVISSSKNADGEHYTGGVPFPFTKALRVDFPQYATGQLMQNYGPQITVRTTKITNPEGNKFIEPTGVYFAEPQIAELFELKFLAGGSASLGDVNTVVLSRKMAEKYFIDWKEAVGGLINFDNEKFDYHVAGVFEDVPDNSDFPFCILASYVSFEAHNANGWNLDDWGSNTSNHQVFMLLPKASQASAVNRQLVDFEKRHNTSNRTTNRKYELNPMANIHFDERVSVGGDHQSSWSSLYTLTSIALLVLLMACINFVNLSTALAITRSKEVGVRKVLGGSSAQVRLQIFTETTVVVALATLLAVAIAWLALPYIKQMMVVQTPLELFEPINLLALFAIASCTVLLSGLYPAFVMGGFRPVEAIKNKIEVSKVGSLSLRRVLVVVQFAFSQIFIIATIIAVSQMNFIRNADLGFTKESVLTLAGNPDSASRSRQLAFKNELLTRPDVKSVSFSLDAPSSENSWQSNFAFDGLQDRDFDVSLKMADENYAATYGLELVAGTFYGPGDTAKAYVVNETFVRKVGLKRPQDAIGKMMRLGGQPIKPVCGVVKDFHAQSLREVVPPILIHVNKRHSALTGIRLSSTNLLKASKEIEALWNKYYPEYVYSPRFLEEQIEDFYQREAQMSLMYKVYAFLAIFISCLGLYGLISYIVVQKTREVGIRKVLGASVRQIVFLLSKEFTVLIAVAFVLAAPTAWYFMNLWLRDFAYKVSIGPLVFVAGILISGAVAWITVGYKAFAAALTNPVQNLRTE